MIFFFFLKPVILEIHWMFNRLMQLPQILIVKIRFFFGLTWVDPMWKVGFVCE